VHPIEGDAKKSIHGTYFCGVSAGEINPGRHTQKAVYNLSIKKQTTYRFNNVYMSVCVQSRLLAWCATMFCSEIANSSLFISSSSWNMEMCLQTEDYWLLDYGVLLIGNLIQTSRNISPLPYFWSSKEEKEKEKK
jgi:hypothetical protein